MTDAIDTGDHVLHGPTGETWIVARVAGEELTWCGWPEGWAKLADCTLVRKASPIERAGLLVVLAKSQHHCSAWATDELARRQHD